MVKDSFTKSPMRHFNSQTMLSLEDPHTSSLTGPFAETSPRPSARQILPQTPVQPRAINKKADPKQSGPRCNCKHHASLTSHLSVPSPAKMPPKQPSATPRDQRPSKPASSPVKNAYLLAYNAVSAALWAGVLYKTVSIGAHEVDVARKAGSFFGRSEVQSVAAGLASGKVFQELDEYTRLVQSLAALEVLHSLVGKFFLSSPEGKEGRNGYRYLGSVIALYLVCDANTHQVSSAPPSSPP